MYAEKLATKLGMVNAKGIPTGKMVEKANYLIDLGSEPKNMGSMFSFTHPGTSNLCWPYTDAKYWEVKRTGPRGGKELHYKGYKS